MDDAPLLALDAGTTGVTAVLYGRDLEPTARAYAEFPQHYPQPGWVEHDAGELLAAVDAVLKEILTDGVAPRALGITNQRETVFACERDSGRALRRGIVWQDRRTADRCGELERGGHGALVRARTGLLLDPYFSATKIEWMLGEDPGLARRAEAGEVVFCTVDALVVAHLTGASVWSTDPTNAARTMLYDIDARSYDADLCALFGVSPDWLPAVRASTAFVGETLPERTGGRALPIHGVAGDQQAALFGQGCVAAGSFKATYGTGAFLLLNSGSERVDSEAGLVTTLAVGADGQPCYALEGSVFVSGAAVQFLRDQLGLIASADEIEALARSVPDSGGVTFVPAFTGLGAPYWDPDARGALLGLTRGTTRAHVARATLEALALQNAELIEVFRADSGLPIETMLADGGAAANDLLLQLQADSTGTVVQRPPSVEATARGAAALAGLGLGVWSTSDVPAAGGSGGRAFRPRLGAAERAEQLSAWRRAVARIRSA